MNIKKLFTTSLGFSSQNDLIESHLSFKDNQDLTERLKNKIYLYENSNQANTTFYLFDKNLNPEEIKTIHKHIWIENKADLFIFPRNDQIEIGYTKTSPEYKPIIIDKIPTNEDDNKLLEKISKTHFDSGIFWLTYKNALKRIQKQRQTVDVKLIDTLEHLRGDLEKIYSKIISDETEKKNIIQALIDRTLFIKFLEDRKIINSYFFEHYFQDNNLTYKKLLKKGIEENNASEINKLFEKINKICNNVLFEEPIIKQKYLLSNVLELLYHTISQTGLRSGQLNLFDFEFDIIPIEFISHIYEVFLEDKRKKEGIYFTPKGLANLVLDSVIEGNKYGKVLDPSCGSGIFLVLAFRRMLRAKKMNSSNIPDTLDLIKKRNEFLKSNIFGIEKESTARRLTIFSLYLEMLNDIEPEKIKELIKVIIEDKNLKLFPENFDENIFLGNAVEIDENKKPFKNEKFDFIVGNPPWKKIDAKKDNEENKYWIANQQNLGGIKQLSQCFLLEIKNWSRQNTKYGFVINSSNFYNETHIKFQDFFFKNYNIKKFYELSKIKKILFRSAKEEASVIIFNNRIKQDNYIKYLSPDLTDFAKTFNIILLKKEDIISILQKDLIDKKISLRIFLMGNENDLELLRNFQNHNYQPLSNYLLNQNFIHNGLQIIGGKKVSKEFQIENWNELSKEEKDSYKSQFIEKYTKSSIDNTFKIPFIKKLLPYKITNNNCYLEDIYESGNTEKFERVRKKNKDIYEGKRILFKRTGKSISAVLVEDKLYCYFDIYVLKLQQNYYDIILAIMNSSLVEYYITLKHRLRVGSSFTKSTKKRFLTIPIPDIISIQDNTKNQSHSSYQATINNIIELSQKLTEGEYSFEEKNEELDDLIFDLYDLNILERDRILDFFKTGKAKESDIEEYCKTFNSVFKPYLKDGVNLRFEYYYQRESFPIDFAGIKIIFEKKEKLKNKPLISKVVKYLTLDLLKSVGSHNILELKERIYGENCIYLIKDKNIKSWTVTKAIEDAQAEIKRICK